MPPLAMFTSLTTAKLRVHTSMYSATGLSAVQVTWLRLTRWAGSLAGGKHDEH